MGSPWRARTGAVAGALCPRVSARAAQPRARLVERGATALAMGRWSRSTIPLPPVWRDCRLGRRRGGSNAATPPSGVGPSTEASPRIRCGGLGSQAGGALAWGLLAQGRWFLFRVLQRSCWLCSDDSWSGHYTMFGESSQLAVAWVILPEPDAADSGWSTT